MQKSQLPPRAPAGRARAMAQAPPGWPSPRRTRRRAPGAPARARRPACAIHPSRSWRLELGTLHIMAAVLRKGSSSTVGLTLLLASTTFAQPPQIPVLNWAAGRSDWLNVKTGCGAAGDGATDDTEALTACIARISNNGGSPLNEPAPGHPSTLYFPAGQYVLSQTLTLNETQGKALIGHGETTVLLWKGAIDGIMLRSDGAPRQIYMGLSWAGNGVAGVGIDHNSVSTNFETRIRHSNEKFTGFRNASIRIGYNTTATGKIESAEILYENCVFADSNTGAGLAFLNFNDCTFCFQCALCRLERCSLRPH